jgi:Xaa-Pro aminopeptidase
LPNFILKNRKFININKQGFYLGMTTSNEPGYYQEGSFGIRIENVCITVKADTPYSFGGKTYCSYQTVTMVPISTKLIAIELLEDSELVWINEYNLKVQHTLMPLMQEKYPEAIDYLVRETKPLLRTL